MNLISLIENCGEQEIRYRKASYSGRGRPKRSDYVMIKMKDLEDYYATEILQNAFTATL